MDAVLRPLDLTVPQYACLELLGRTPGLSNADLARGAFVTRQSMNGVLRGLQDRGLVTRPRSPPAGAPGRPSSPTRGAHGCRMLRTPCSPSRNACLLTWPRSKDDAASRI
jgi:hypothetical protein